MESNVGNCEMERIGVPICFLYSSPPLFATSVFDQKLITGRITMLTNLI
jgi:hypothetical protein